MKNLLIFHFLIYLLQPLFDSDFQNPQESKYFGKLGVRDEKTSTLIGYSNKELIELEKCINLEVLKLNINRCDSFPSAIFSMKKIQVIMLLGNKQINIEKDINKLSDSLEIYEFYLHYFKLSRFPCKLLNYNKIHILSLTELGLENIPDEISIFNKLRILNFESNCITDIPISITQLKNLEYLDLKNNNIKVFPVSILKMPSLIKVELTGNPLSEKNKQELMANKGNIELLL